MLMNDETKLPTQIENLLQELVNFIETEFKTWEPEYDHEDTRKELSMRLNLEMDFNLDDDDVPPSVMLFFSKLADKIYDLPI